METIIKSLEQNIIEQDIKFFKKKC